MQRLSSEQFKSFVEAKAAAVVHFDEDWNGQYRTMMRRQMRDAERSLSDRANFGEVDCTSSPELAKSIPILNVPAVAYYGGGKLIAVLIGANQDIRGCLDRVLLGESIGQDNVAASEAIEPRLD
jgi:thioredoxin-like negative regulator of GroEL